MYLVNNFAIASEGERITLETYVTKKAPVGADTVGLTTGSFLIFEAVSELRKSNKSTSSAVTSSALGLSTILGSITIVAKAADLPQTSEDSVRKFRKSETFHKLVAEFGEKRANQLVLDVYAGWTVEKILEKYVTNEADREKIGEILSELKDKQVKAKLHEKVSHGLVEE